MTEKRLASGKSFGGGTENENPPPNVKIENFHHSANDLEELRKIAEVNPELASQIVNQRDNEDQRDHTSERIGVGAGLIMGLATLAAIVFLITFGGFWKLAIGVIIIVVLSALVRVILTGEWSDTSWTGTVLNKLANVFGGLPADDDDSSD